jgi:hypothetical protein
MRNPYFNHSFGLPNSVYLGHRLENIIQMFDDIHATNDIEAVVLKWIRGAVEIMADVGARGIKVNVGRTFDIVFTAAKVEY